MDSYSNPASAGRKQRILIVDDEESVVLTLRSGLRRLPNCEVMTATDGEQALQLFACEPFDLLMTDLNMPGMNGLTLASHVREMYPETAIIMITAYGNEMVQAQAKEISVHCILDKPVELAAIRAAAMEALEK